MNDKTRTLTVVDTTEQTAAEKQRLREARELIESAGFDPDDSTTETKESQR